MKTVFSENQVNFSDCEGGIATSTPHIVNFDYPVMRANVAMKGFQIEFNRAEKKLQKIVVYLDDVNIENKVVSFRGNLGIKDDSGIYDDKYSGYINALVIAEVEDQQPSL